MIYVVLMYANPAETKAISAADLQTVSRKHDALRTELTTSGELLNGAGLLFPADTKTLRLREGAAVRTDGPLTEGEEHLTAYYVVDCASLDRALTIADSVLDFHVTAVEVRQVHDSIRLESSSRMSS